jgi:type VI secretion system protein
MNARVLPHLLAAAAALLAACAAIENEVDRALHLEKHSRLSRVVLAAEIGANQNSATQVEVVFVYDDSVLAALPKTAPEWFANRQALLDGLAPALASAATGLPPGSVGELQLEKLPPRPVRVLGYANYLPTGGQRPVDLTGFRCVLLRLQAQTVSPVRIPCA